MKHEAELQKWAEDSRYETFESLLFRHNLIKSLKQELESKPLVVLEYGTLIGCSAAWMASAMEDRDKLITLDYTPDFTEEATRRIKEVGLDHIISCVVMDARFPDLDELLSLVGTPYAAHLFSMDASHDYVGCCLEYAGAERFLFDHHVLIVDDAKVTGINNFINETQDRYKYSVRLPLHNGLAILSDDDLVLDHILWGTE